jgi:hypothetical protein
MTSSCFPHLSVRVRAQWREDPFSSLILLQALAIAESVCVQLAVNHGLGRHQNSLSHPEFVAYSKVLESPLKSQTAHHPDPSFSGKLRRPDPLCPSFGLCQILRHPDHRSHPITKEGLACHSRCRGRHRIVDDHLGLRAGISMPPTRPVADPTQPLCLSGLEPPKPGRRLNSN